MFIDRVNERLKDLNMKGSDLCNKLNIPTSNYTQWKTYIPRGTLIKRIADELHTSADWLLEREEANTPEIMNLINNYKEADQRGKETIVNVAELEARRSRSDRKQPDEPQDSTGRKIDFVDLAVKQNLSYQGKEDQEDDEELKPFA